MRIPLSIAAMSIIAIASAQAKLSAPEAVMAKTVDAGGAIDQNGNPIAYDYAFDFTVSCIYLGQEVVPVADRTFSLSDGASKTFTAWSTPSPASWKCPNTPAWCPWQKLKATTST